MHAINVISGISMLGVFVGSAALIIILSAFNGLEHLILSLYSNFTPELRIEPQQGKTFNPNTPYFKSLSRDVRVFSYTEVLQEKALVRYNNRQFIGTVEGVSDAFLNNKQLDSTIENGSFSLHADGGDAAVIGAEVQGSLGVSINNRFENELQIFSPRRQETNSANPLNDFITLRVPVAGIFSVQQDFDDIVVVPLAFARKLLDQPVEVSAINLNFKKHTNLLRAEREIKAGAGAGYIIKNRHLQNAGLYKTLNYERWSVFMILTFVVIIAIFNIIGSLTMLVMDKRKDIAILTSLGGSKRMIQGIFFFEGMMISLTGCIAGLILGGLFCLVQEHYGLIKMGSKLTVLDAYPVTIKYTDFIVVFLTVSAIAVIASGISARLSVKRLDEIKNEL